MEIGFLEKNACGSCPPQLTEKKQETSSECPMSLCSLARVCTYSTPPPPLSTRPPREESIKFHIIKSLITALAWLPLAHFPGFLKIPRSSQLRLDCRTTPVKYRDSNSSCVPQTVSLPLPVVTWNQSFLTPSLLSFC